MAKLPQGSRPRDVARRALKRVAADEAFATLALSAELDAAGLDQRDRALATELVYGVLRHRSRLDRALAAMAPRGLSKLSSAIRVALRVAAYQILFLDRVPAHAAVDDAVRTVRRIGGGRMGGFANGALRKLAREGEPALPSRDNNLRGYVEQAHSMPAWIVRRLEDHVGAGELEAAAAAMNRPAPLTLRVNTLRTTPTELIERLRIERPDATIETSDRCEETLFTEGLGDPERSPSFGEGLWTVQDLGAQLVARLLAPTPGQHVLDACAGVGGKSSHLAQLTGDDATIDAVDISERKLALAASSARRLGVTSVVTRSADLFAGLPADTYDAALLDAPCTGLGVLRRHPEAKWRLDESAIAEMAGLQARLLDSVAGSVRPGGVLVYSVCTFAREEGPAVIDTFLAGHPDFARDGVDSWTWPHRDRADSFFACRLVRAA